MTQNLTRVVTGVVRLSFANVWEPKSINGGDPKNPPQIVDAHVAPILDRGEIYSGCYARVSINFYAFNTYGNRGVVVGLGNIQKIRDGEPLSGGNISAQSDFGAFSTPAADDFLS